MKNETKHTKGPWGESYITEINHHAKSIISTPRGDLITEQNLGLGWGERAANARLIAAAPELLEACKAMVLWQNTPAHVRGDFPPIQKQMIQSIAKAEGEKKGDD